MVIVINSFIKGRCMVNLRPELCNYLSLWQATRHVIASYDCALAHLRSYEVRRAREDVDMRSAQEVGAA